MALGAWIAVALALLVLLAVGLAIRLRPTGAPAPAGELATRALAGALAGEFAGGTAAHGLGLRNIRYRDASSEVAIDRVHGAWDFSFTPLKLTIASLIRAMSM